jgi:hypothetical protein
LGRPVQVKIFQDDLSPAGSTQLMKASAFISYISLKKTKKKINGVDSRNS